MMLKNKIELIAENVIKRISLHESQNLDLVDELAYDWGLYEGQVAILKYLVKNGWSEDLTKYKDDDNHYIFDLFSEKLFNYERHIKEVSVEGAKETFLIVKVSSSMPEFLMYKLLEKTRIDTGFSEIDNSFHDSISKFEDDINIDFYDRMIKDKELHSSIVEFTCKLLNAKPVEVESSEEWVFVLQ